MRDFAALSDQDWLYTPNKAITQGDEASKRPGSANSSFPDLDLVPAQVSALVPTPPPSTKMMFKQFI